MFQEFNDKAYIVGGAVRDALMGLVPSDVDYCVEATQEEFEKVFPNIECVGNSFPVYLINHNEVALTRTERKTGNKYQDFDCSVGVSIEDDLSRRDFTINSIAKKYDTGEIIDPFNGVNDIENRILRCVNPKAFIEDPLRIIRGARFVVRFDMVIDPDTFHLMCKNAENVRHITKERIVKELKKVWEESEQPSVFFNILSSIGALKYIIEPLEKLKYVIAGPKEYHHGLTAFDHTMEVIDRAKKNDASFLVFIAAIFHDSGKGTTDPKILPHHYKHELRSYDITNNFLKDHKFDSNINRYVPLIARNHMKVFYLTQMRDIKVVRFALLIKNYFDDYFNLVNSDHPLFAEKVEMFEKMKQVVDYKLSKNEVKRISKVSDKRSFYEKRLLSFYRTIKNK